MQPPRNLVMSTTLHDYVRDVSLRETDIARRLRQETAPMKGAMMQISPEQGQLLALLVQLVGAKKCLELGTFTGYSALWVAEALPPDGRIVCCDVSEEWTSIGRRFWREAGVNDKIDLRIAPALETLRSLLDTGEAETFDFAFIDAEKSEYDAYYEAVLQLMHPGGLIVFDNMFMGGRVTDPAVTSPGVTALRALNRKLHADDRVGLAMLPIGDGVTLAMKR
ncbi:MAG: class I SAM-dependent methyltransferase [Dehalococcoidia bacterium]